MLWTGLYIRERRGNVIVLGQSSIAQNTQHTIWASRTEREHNSGLMFINVYGVERDGYLCDQQSLQKRNGIKRIESVVSLTESEWQYV